MAEFLEGKIKSELLGVESSNDEATVAKDEDWFELAADVYAKKLANTPIEDRKEKARRVRFMVSRGFTPDSVFRLFSN